MSRCVPDCASGDGRDVEGPIGGRTEVADYRRAPVCLTSSVLIQQNRVPIRVRERQARRPGRRFVRLSGKYKPGGLDLPLQLTDIGELIEILSIT
jgi:hypothetical protein